MALNSLYIVGGNEKNKKFNIEKNSKVIFLDKFEDLYDNQLSLTKILQADQEILRKKFIELQENVIFNY